MPISSQMQAVLDQYAKFDPPAIESLTPENGRNAPSLKNAVEEMMAESVAARARMLARPSLPQPVSKIDHVLIPGPGGDILARIFIPDGEGPFPVIVYFHGGGWVIANLDVYESSCRALCNAAMMPWFWKHYLENEAQGLEPYASPIQAPDLSGMPPAIVITAEFDPLRDEGEAYAKRLSAAGVPVRVKRYDGVTHEFFGLAGVVDNAKKAVKEAAQGLKRIFGHIGVTSPAR